MKKVGLCIVYRNCNYGSILQSYATILKLKSLGCDCEIIRYSPAKTMGFIIRALPRLMNRDMAYSKMRMMKRKAAELIYPTFAEDDRIRQKKFQCFIREHFGKFSEVYHHYRQLSENTGQYDAVLVGSDQVWLPSGLAANFYNLMFVPNEIRKISYSTSFGVSKIPFYQKRRTKAYLDRIDYLSVREQTGYRIIQELTGKAAEVILDPTMIIDRALWDEHIPDRKIVEGDYLFCYFLGDNPRQRQEAKKLAEEKNLKIVMLRHLDEYIPSDENFGDIALYDAGPEEFVNLIRHACFVCTDSFHGSVFSILYHKRFISFNRYGDSSNSRNSRLDTLYSSIGIDRKFVKNLTEEMMNDIDYETVDQNINRLRLEADHFIRNALSGL